MNETMESGSTDWTINIEPRVAVIGVGGAGCKAIDHIYWSGAGFETVAINTDREALLGTGAHRRICLCPKVTGGEGTDGDHDLGRSCALTHTDEIEEAVGGHDIVFIVAGMGGGTGTGAAPVVAEISRRMEIITFAIAINPFSFEGRRRQVARDGLRRLRAVAPLTTVVENDLILEQAPDAGMKEAFSMANAGIHDYINKSKRKVTEAFLEHLAELDLDVGDSYEEWSAVGTDTVRMHFL